MEWAELPLSTRGQTDVAEEAFQLELGCAAGQRQRLCGTARPPDARSASGCQLFWCGALSDKVGLCQALGRPPTTPTPALVLACLERFGESALARMAGRWALAWIKPSGAVLLARDPMGGQGLWWAAVPGGFLIATQWQSLFADARWDRQLNDNSLAAFFSVHFAPVDGASFHRGLQLVPPGSVIRLDDTDPKPASFWAPLSQSPWPDSEGDAQDEYRRLLQAAIEASIEGARAPALLLSGGLDSGSIAAIAARLGVPLQTVSWSLQSVPMADESSWIHALATALGLSCDIVAADGIWPLHPLSEHHAPAIGPLLPPFAGLRRQTYQRAADLGADVVLTGDGADALFMGTESWLRGLLASAQWANAVSGMRAEWKARRLSRCLLNQVRELVPGRLRAMRQSQGLPWLTQEASTLLAERMDSLRDDGRRRRWRALQPGWGDYHELALAPGFNQLGLRVRHPFRDQRLAELAMRMPPQWLYQPGQTKRLAREALRGVLPEPTRIAARRGSLLPLATRFLTNSLDVVRSTLQSRHCDWQRWVRQDWMEAALVNLPRIGRDGPGWLVVWNCVAYELWKQRAKPFAATV